MTHKQVKFGKGKRSRKVKQVEEEYESGSAYRRAVLLSCDDVDRMAVESSRARLINHLVSKSEDHSSREFASYYRGPTRYIDPPYSITSHTNRVPIPKVQQVIPAYPSFIQAPRWSTRPRSEQNSETDFMMDQKFNCRCINCTSPNCPAKYCNMFKPRRFKDNIMTFCDQYTMTRKVNDAGCGRTPIPSTPNCSDVYVPCASSMVAIRDAQGTLKIRDMYSRHCTPVPILKKGCADSVYYDCVNRKLMSDEFQDEVVRDIEPLTTKSVKCFYRKENTGTDYVGEELSRKNIYNEGISDVIAVKPLSLKKVLSPPPVCSRSSVGSNYDSDNDNYIPYSHTSESKYHKKCVNPPQMEYVNDDGTESTRHHIVIPSPRIICKTYSSKPYRRCKQPQRSIKLPRKVLTSERVIDSCIDKHPHNKMPCRKK